MALAPQGITDGILVGFYVIGDHYVRMGSWEG